MEVEVRRSEEEGGLSSEDDVAADAPEPHAAELQVTEVPTEEPVFTSKTGVRQLNCQLKSMLLKRKRQLNNRARWCCEQQLDVRVMTTCAVAI